MKKLIFIRDGGLDYLTGSTCDNDSEISHSAERILKKIGFGVTVDIVCPSIPSSRVAVNIVADVLGKNRSIIKEEQSLRGMDFYDWEKGCEKFSAYKTVHETEQHYATDPVFEEGVYFEKRSEIQRRFACYLGSLFESHASGILPDVTIHSSHFEVLWKIVYSMCENGETIRHGEVLMIELCDFRTPITVCRLSFRNKEKVYEVGSVSSFFGKQFGFDVFG